MHFHEKIYIKFIAVIFIIAPSGNHLNKFSLTDKWVKI